MRPTVSRTAGTLTIKGPGFTAEFRSATLDEAGRQILVQLN